MKTKFFQFVPTFTGRREASRLDFVQMPFAEQTHGIHGQ